MWCADGCEFLCKTFFAQLALERVLLLDVGEGGESELGAVIGLHLFHSDLVLLEEVQSLPQEAHGVVGADVVVDPAMTKPRVFVDGGVLILSLAADGIQVLDIDLDVSAWPGALVALVFAASTALGGAIEARTLEGFVDAADASLEAVVRAQEPVETVQTGGRLRPCLSIYVFCLATRLMSAAS